MGSDSDRPFVDAQYFTDLDTYVYEAVATLEHSGHPPTRSQIAAATDLDDHTADEVLGALAEHGVLTRTRSGGEEAFELARRDWSATPDTPSR
jgi:DNA-binding IclR family transcriptional regulator